MAAPRLRKVQSLREMENQIDDYVTQGYQILERGQSSAMLRRSTWGTFGGHVICLLFTAGLGNIIYALVAHFTAERVFVKLDES